MVFEIMKEKNINFNTRMKFMSKIENYRYNIDNNSYYTYVL